MVQSFYDNSPIDNLIIVSVSKSTEQQAKNLIVEGLSEHFPYYDQTKNPDIDGIIENFINNGDTFMTGLVEEKVICTGALVKENRDTGRIVRMSVDKAYRGRGIAKKMLYELEKASEEKGYKNIVIETNIDWYSAINLYRSCGYVEYKNDRECIHFLKTMEV